MSDAERNDDWCFHAPIAWKTHHAHFVEHPTQQLVAKIYTRDRYYGDLDAVEALHQHIFRHVTQAIPDSYVFRITNIIRSRDCLAVVMPRAYIDLLAFKRRLSGAGTASKGSSSNRSFHGSEPFRSGGGGGSGGSSTTRKQRKRVPLGRNGGLGTRLHKSHSVSSKVSGNLTPCHPVTDAEQTIVWLYQMLSALAHIHDSGYVHGDVKPSNFLCIRGSDKLFLADFDCMQPIMADSVGLVGTPAFMCPSVVNAYMHGVPHKVTPAIDMWGLGMTLLWLLTGMSPLEKYMNDMDMSNPTDMKAKLGIMQTIMQYGWVMLPAEAYHPAKTMLAEAWPAVHYILCVCLVPSIHHRARSAADLMRILQHSIPTRRLLRRVTSRAEHWSPISSDSDPGAELFVHRTIPTLDQNPSARGIRGAGGESGSSTTRARTKTHSHTYAEST